MERIAEFPGAATELLRQIPLQRGSPYDIREWIRSDAALTEDVAGKARIKAGIADAAAAPEEIIGQVDMDLLAEIALTILVRGYIKEALSVSSVNKFWRYTLACALACRELSQFTSINAAMAYTGGLLHDVGRLALMAAYPDKYGNLLLLVQRMLTAEETINVGEYERMLFGLDRFEIAGWLAERWGLPPALRPIVGKFQSNGDKKAQEFVKTVGAGCSVAHSLGYGMLAPVRRTGQGARRPAISGPVPGVLQAPPRMMAELPGFIEKQLSYYAML